MCLLSIEISFHWLFQQEQLLVKGFLLTVLPIQSQMTALMQHPSVSRDLETELQTRVGLLAVASSLERSLGADKVRCLHPLLHFKTAGTLQDVCLYECECMCMYVLSVYTKDSSAFLQFSTPLTSKSVPPKSHFH